MRSALDLLLIPGPVAKRRSGGAARKVTRDAQGCASADEGRKPESAMDAREFSVSTWMYCRRTPPDRREPRGSIAGRVAPGGLSLGDFSLAVHCAAGAARTPKAAPKGGGQASAWMHEVEQRRSGCRMPGVKRSYSAAAEADETLRQHNQWRGKPCATIKVDSSSTRAARCALGLRPCSAVRSLRSQSPE